MILAIFTALSPFAVAMITQALKKLPIFANLPEGVYTGLLRLLVAALAFLAAVGQAWMAGSEVDTTTVQMFADAVQVFLAASGAYFFVRPK